MKGLLWTCRIRSKAEKSAPLRIQEPECRLRWTRVYGYAGFGVDRVNGTFTFNSALCLRLDGCHWNHLRDERRRNHDRQFPRGTIGVQGLENSSHRIHGSRGKRRLHPSSLKRVPNTSARYPNVKLFQLSI